MLPDDFPEGYYPHNIAIFGDVGVNAVMTPQILAEVAVGTCAVARDLVPEDVLPEIHGAIVSYSHRGSDEGPSPDTVRHALALIPSVLERRIAVGERYRSIRITGEVKFSAAISRRSAELYGMNGLATGTNVIISPNLETGNLLYHLYAARFPAAKKVARPFRRRLPRRRSRDGLLARRRPPGDQGVGAPAAARWTVDADSSRHVLPPVPRPRDQPRFDVDEDRGVRG